MKSKTVLGIVVSITLTIIAYFSIRIFVIQPIGAIPDGATIVYWRVGMDLPFVSSVDGILFKRTGTINLFGRAMGMAKLTPPILERKIIRLPFNQSLYRMSTGGLEFEK